MSVRSFFGCCINRILIVLVAAITVGADGLPGEYLLTQRWRDMISRHSPLTNPAFLTEENYPTFRIAFAPILKGAFKLGEAGFTLPVGLYHSAGISVIGEFDGEVVPGIPGADGQIVPGTESYTNNNLFFMFTWAYHFWNRFSIGFNLNTAYQSNFERDPLISVGFDLGLTYRLPRHSLLGDHILGISTQNLVAPSLGNEYSRDLKFSWLGNYMEERFESALDIDIRDFLASPDEFLNPGDGSSLSKKIEYDINLKLGAWLMQMAKVYLQFGFDEKIMDYWGFALGFNLPSFWSGRDLEFLWQYNIMTGEENDATGVSVYARMEMGKHREEIFARRMARLASLSPNELYNMARTLYFEEKYWDAYFVFSRITAEFPDFFKNDWVQYYRGSCQEKLDMREMSVNNYEKTKKDYPLSSAVPHADLGIMRVLYRNNDFAGVSNQFAELNKPNVTDSLRYHGAYLMGQSYLQNDEPQKAVGVLELVPEDHPDYIYAQHASAVAYARMDSDIYNIVFALENCIGAKALDNAQKEIQNRSYLFLGYLFYEDNALSKAVVALRMVPTTSYYAEDALLGQGWTALKAKQWSDCIGIGQMLEKRSKKPVLQCDGMLIQAYGYLLQKDYSEAMNLLKTASEKISSAVAPSQDTLNYYNMQYDSDRMSHNFFSEKVEKLSLTGESSTKTAQADSFFVEQNSYIKKFDKFYEFIDEFKRSTFFARNIDVVRDDINYAMATVQRIIGQSGTQKVQQEIGDKQKKIDEEINRLEKEMQRLQKKAD